jgi:hypothetical protein
MTDLGGPPETRPTGIPTRRELRTGSISVQRADPPSSPLLSSSVPRIGAIVVAVVGALLVLAGVLAGSVFAPEATTTARLTGSTQGKPVVLGRPGLLGLEGNRVKVTATSADRGPVFLGIGRAGDVGAYVGPASRIEIDGQDGEGALTSRAAGSETSLPDPAGVDVWVLSQRGRGSAALDWPAVEGPWVLLAASDGQGAAPAQISLTWSGRPQHSSGPVLIAVGAVLFVCGGVLFVMLRSRSKLAASS